MDVIGILRSKKHKLLTGVSYITDKLHYHFTDRARKQLQTILESKLPGNEVVVTSMSKDVARVLIRTYSDRSMGVPGHGMSGGLIPKCNFMPIGALACCRSTSAVQPADV